MKNIAEYIKESYTYQIDAYTGPKRKILKTDFEICTFEEYDEQPRELKDFSMNHKIIEFAKTHKGWYNEGAYIVPAGTKLKYLGLNDDYAMSEFEITDGPAKGMTFVIDSELVNEIE